MERPMSKFHSHHVPLSWSWNLAGTLTSWVTMRETPPTHTIACSLPLLGPGRAASNTRG